MDTEHGRIGAADRASRASHQAPTGLDHAATIPCACRHVKWNHVDGPMMCRTDGTLKWLSWWERLMHWIGKWSLDDIARRPDGFSKLVYYPPAGMWLDLKASDAEGVRHDR